MVNQDQEAPKDPNSDQGELPPTGSIADISWIAGHWWGEAFGGIADEVWSPPSGKTMMGMYRLIKDGEVVFYEFLIIVEESGSLTLKLKHFNPDFTGWEEKDSSIDFPLLRCEQDAVYFDGISFHKVDQDTMKVLLKIKGEDGEVREMEFLYRRK
jgi:hypothetical protein